MTENEMDMVYLKIDDITRKVSKLVNRCTEFLTPAEDELVRQLLTENYRFWRSHTEE